MLPKYKVGDIVHAYRKETADWIGFDVVGRVEWVHLADDEYEYRHRSKSGG